MGAGFEIDVEGRASRLGAGLFDRQNLRVLYAVVGVEAAAYDFAMIVDDDCAYAWVGRSQGDAFPRQVLGRGEEIRRHRRV